MPTHRAGCIHEGLGLSASAWSGGACGGGAGGSVLCACTQPAQCRFHRAYGVVSMCIGTGMGAAAVFEYPGTE